MPPAWTDRLISAALSRRDAPADPTEGDHAPSTAVDHTTQSDGDSVVERDGDPGTPTDAHEAASIDGDNTPVSDGDEAPEPSVDQPAPADGDHGSAAADADDAAMADADDDAPTNGNQADPTDATEPAHTAKEGDYLPPIGDANSSTVGDAVPTSSSAQHSGSAATREVVVLAVAALAVIGVLSWFLFSQMGDKAERISPRQTTEATAPEDDSDLLVADLPGQYVVEDGDTLLGIASKLEVDPEVLQTANALANPDLLRVGQELTVPSSSSEVQSVNARRTLRQIALALRVDPTILAAYNTIDIERMDLPVERGALVVPTRAPLATPEEPPADLPTYVVAEGDTLLSIAEELGLDAADLAAANKLDDPDRLAVGQVLVLPITE